MKSAIDNLKYILNPRSIAIVGASRNMNKIGNKVLRNLILGGFKGNIYPVNPNTKEIYNQMCFPNISCIPNNDIDIVWIRVCIRDLLDVVKETINKNAKVVVINSKEIDTKEGKIIIGEVKKALELKGIILLGLGSAGIYSENLNLYSGISIPKAGGLSFLTQSDNLIDSIVDLWNDDNIGVENIIGLGSKLGLNESDILNFYLSHTEYLPKIICMYLENLSTPKESLSVLNEITKKIPIIAMFPISNPITRNKALTHSGSVLQDYQYLKLALEKVGVNFVNSITELSSLTMLYKNIGKDFYANWLPFVLTNSFFLTLEAHSMLYKHRIATLEPNGELKLKLLGFYSKENKNEIDYLSMIDRLFKEEDLDTIFLSLTKDEYIDLNILAEGIERLEREYNKIVIVTVLEINHKVDPHKIFNSRNIANYKYLENAIYAYTELRKRAQYLSKAKNQNNKRQDDQFMRVDFEKKSEMISIIKELKNQVSKSVNFVTSKKLLKSYCLSFIDDYEAEKESDQHHEYILNVKFVKDRYSNENTDSSIGYKLELNLIYHEDKEFVNLIFNDLIPLDFEGLEILIYEKFRKVFVDDKKINSLNSEVKRLVKALSMLIEDYQNCFEKVNVTFISSTKLVFLVEESEIDIVI